MTDNNIDTINNEIKTPDVLNLDYRFERLLGEGANGRTWLAIHRQTGTQVAVKELKFSDDFKAKELFQREAGVLSSVHVKGVPTFYQWVLQEGLDDACYIVQEFIPHPSLQSALEEGRIFSEAEVSQILMGVAQILDVLETQYTPPIIHRDIKPANIMFDDMTDQFIHVWLIDFGAVANPQKQSGGSTIAGTFGYMAPEQLQGECAVQSDYYALGATALHLLTGVSPYKIDTELFQLQYEPVLEEHAPETSLHMRHVLKRLLAPNAPDRPQTSTELIKLLRGDEDDEIVVKEESWFKKKLNALKKLLNTKKLKWVHCKAIIRGVNYIHYEESLKNVLEATYEYKKDLYHAFVLVPNWTVRIFNIDDMPQGFDRTGVYNVDLRCNDNDPSTYTIDSQRVWITPDLYDYLPDLKALGDKSTHILNLIKRILDVVDNDIQRLHLTSTVESLYSPHAMNILNTVMSVEAEIKRLNDCEAASSPEILRSLSTCYRCILACHTKLDLGAEVGVRYLEKSLTDISEEMEDAEMFMDISFKRISALK